jgi:hypothetical protein
MAQLFKAYYVYFDRSEKKFKAQNNPMILNMDMVESFVQDIDADVEGEPQFILTLSSTQGNTLRVLSKYLEKLMELVE